MNTADIRNLEMRQWLFWATAVPLTVLVMGLSLIVVYKFEPARQFWFNFFGSWDGWGNVCE